MATRSASSTSERTKSTGNVICHANTTAKRESPQPTPARSSSPTMSIAIPKFDSICGKNTKWTSYRISSTINSKIIISASVSSVNNESSACLTLAWIWYPLRHQRRSRAHRRPSQRPPRQSCHGNIKLCCWPTGTVTLATTRTRRITTCRRTTQWNGQGQTHRCRHRLRPTSMRSFDAVGELLTLLMSKVFWTIIGFNFFPIFLSLSLSEYSISERDMQHNVKFLICEIKCQLAKWNESGHIVVTTKWAHFFLFFY